MSGAIEFLKRKLLPGEDVRDRAVKGSIWLFGIRGLGRTLQTLKLVFLARLLAPSDFGLMGIALLALAVLEQFSKLGLDTALVQREEDDIDPYLNTAWVMKLVRGVMLGAVAFLAAPLFASFFGDSRVTDLVRVLAVIPVLNGLVNPGLIYFKKDLEFHKQFVFDTVGNIVNFVSAIAFALVYPSVWALVVGNLAGEIVKLAVSYPLHEYRPSIQLDLPKARELFGYGKWLTASGAVIFLLQQGDDAFVGWYLGASALGFYQLAFRFGNAPATELSHVLSNVLLSTFSKVQQDIGQLRTVLIRSLQVIMFLSFPTTVGIIVVAPLFVPVILGERWTPIVMELQILAIGALFLSLDSVFDNLFRAVGRPDIGTKIMSVRLVLMAAIIYPVTVAFGTEGTAVAVTVPAALTLIVSSYIAARTVKLPFLELLIEISYPLTSALLMGLVVYQVREWAPFGSGLAELIGLIALGVVVQILLTWSLSRVSSYDIWSTVSMAVKTVR